MMTMTKGGRVAYIDGKRNHSIAEQQPGELSVEADPGKRGVLEEEEGGSNKGCCQRSCVVEQGEGVQTGILQQPISVDNAQAVGDY